MSLPEEVDVLIVGAGPAGLTTACSLIVHGTPKERIAIVDQRLEHDQQYSRALVIHAKTLQMLEKISVTDRLISLGRTETHITFNSLSSGPLISYDASTLAKYTKYAFVLIIPQSDSEQVLYGRLKELLGEGGDVCWGKKAVSVREDEEGWKVVSFEGGGRVRARYVVGADGGHSVVRQAANIPYPDPFDKPNSQKASPQPPQLDHPSKADEVFCLADLRVSFPPTPPPGEKHPLPRSGVNAYITPSGPSLWIPFTQDRYRIVGQIMDGSEAPAKPTKEYMQAMLERRFPAKGVEVTELVWSSRFYVKFRLAERYFEERVPGSAVRAVGEGEGVKGGLCVVGDAAHVHSPMGGQGMNLGIRDSIYLGQALSHCLTPTNPLTPTQARDLLTRWSSDRHAAGKRVILLAGGITAFGANSAGWIGWIRDWAMWLVGLVPGFRGQAVYMLSGLGEKEAEY